MKYEVTEKAFRWIGMPFRFVLSIIWLIVLILRACVNPDDIFFDFEYNVRGLYRWVCGSKV